jgi:hypothetical protein
MNKKKQRMFECDRRMELRLRLAAKKIGKHSYPSSLAGVMAGPPEREILDRLIERVRSL